MNDSDSHSPRRASFNGRRPATQIASSTQALKMSTLHLFLLVNDYWQTIGWAISNLHQESYFDHSSRPLDAHFRSRRTSPGFVMELRVVGSVGYVLWNTKFEPVIPTTVTNTSQNLQ